MNSTKKNRELKGISDIQTFTSISSNSYCTDESQRPSKNSIQSNPVPFSGSHQKNDKITESEKSNRKSRNRISEASSKISKRSNLSPTKQAMNPFTKQQAISFNGIRERNYNAGSGIKHPTVEMRRTMPGNTMVDSKTGSIEDSKKRIYRENDHLMRNSESSFGLNKNYHNRPQNQNPSNQSSQKQDPHSSKKTSKRGGQNMPHSSKKTSQVSSSNNKISWRENNENRNSSSKHDGSSTMRNLGNKESGRNEMRYDQGAVTQRERTPNRGELVFGSNNRATQPPGKRMNLITSVESNDHHTGDPYAGRKMTTQNSSEMHKISPRRVEYVNLKGDSYGPEFPQNSGTKIPGSNVRVYRDHPKDNTPSRKFTASNRQPESEKKENISTPRRIVKQTHLNEMPSPYVKNFNPTSNVKNTESPVVRKYTQDPRIIQQQQGNQRIPPSSAQRLTPVKVPNTQSPGRNRVLYQEQRSAVKNVPPPVNKLPVNLMESGDNSPREVSPLTSTHKNSNSPSFISRPLTASPAPIMRSPFRTQQFVQQHPNSMQKMVTQPSDRRLTSQPAQFIQPQDLRRMTTAPQGIQPMRRVSQAPQVIGSNNIPQTGLTPTHQYPHHTHITPTRMASQPQIIPAVQNPGTPTAFNPVYVQQPTHNLRTPTRIVNPNLNLQGIPSSPVINSQRSPIHSPVIGTPVHSPPRVLHPQSPMMTPRAVPTHSPHRVVQPVPSPIIHDPYSLKKRKFDDVRLFDTPPRSGDRRRTRSPIPTTERKRSPRGFILPSSRPLSPRPFVARVERSPELQYGKPAVMKDIPPKKEDYVPPTSYKVPQKLDVQVVSLY